VRQALGGDDLFAYIMMQRQVDRRAVILVEGPEDCGIIDPHLMDSVVQTLPGYGKESVLTAAALLHIAGISDVLPVVDSDLDRQSTLNVRYPPNVAASEYHDLDADIFFNCPEITRQIVANFADRDMLRTYLERQQISILDLVTDRASVVGVLRYCSLKYGLGLRMRDFPIEPLMEQESSTISIAAQIACSRTISSPSQEEVEPLLDSQYAGIAERESYCSGHDLTAALATAIRKHGAGKRVGAKMLSAAFRAAVGCACIQKLALFQQVQGWGVLLSIQPWHCGP
jgi:hypothetical protein